jgi:hypothetical protein
MMSPTESDDVEAMVKLLASNNEILAKLWKHFPDDAPSGSGSPTPPPKKETPSTGAPEKKPGIWWGANV